ncbi:Uma2 family endonuclease [Caminibacter sp.]
MTAREYFDYYTFEDYRKWEGDWELIYGMPYAMAPFALPSHQKISVKIVSQLDRVLENCKNCHALMESEVKFTEDTILRPDVFVKCGEIDDITITPEIIFEVVSKSSVQRDEILKFDLSKKEGVKYYRIVYPDEKRVKIFKLINGEYIKVADLMDEVFKIDDLSCEIEINFSKVWK